MENASVTLSISPIQQLLALAFQIWMVVFPIILIRKLDNISALLQDRVQPESDNTSSS